MEGIRVCFRCIEGAGCWTAGRAVGASFGSGEGINSNGAVKAAAETRETGIEGVSGSDSDSSEDEDRASEGSRSSMNGLLARGAIGVMSMSEGDAVISGSSIGLLVGISRVDRAVLSCCEGESNICMSSGEAASSGVIVSSRSG